MTPILFALIGLAFFGWNAFQDGARAAYVFQGLLCFGLLLMVRRQRGRALALVASAGAGLQLAGIGCALWFESLSSQSVGVCDEGTGRPVLAALGIALLFVAAELLRGIDDKRA
jgi:hypothetical protein